MNIPKSVQSAFQCYQEENFHEAKKICTAILKEQSNNEQILHLLGIVHAELAEYDLAIRQLEKLLQLYPNNADAYLALGGILQQKGLNEDAIYLYKKALEIDPLFAEVYENLGDIFREGCQPDDAIQFYKKAIQINPHAAEIYLNLGNIFREKGVNELALYYYRSALRYKADYAEAHNNMGMVFYEQKRLEEAISCYKKALTFDPTLHCAQMNLEVASREKRQFHDALRKHRNRLDVAIRLGLIKVEMMINAVINKFYFQQLNVQFHADTLNNEHVASELKRRILKNIVNDSGAVDNVQGFFDDLDRIIAIQRHCEKSLWKTTSFQTNSHHIAVDKNNNLFAVYEELHREFISLIERIEATLVKVLDY